MDSLLFAILVIINQVSLAGGAVTITFDDNGYIGHSIVLQCKTDATSVVAQSAIWYFNGNVISSNSTGGFSETKTPDGFNLTISSLTVNHAGYYRCRIDFGSSLNKTLGILYNTQSKDISIQKGQSAGTITITITAYPDPTYTVSVTEVQNGLATPVTNVNWTSVKTTQPNDVIIRTLTANNFTKDTYNITVTVTSTWPVPIIVHEMVIFAITTTITASVSIASSTSSTTTMTSDSTQCQLELGLGLGLGLGIQCVIICIVVVILIYTAFEYPYSLGLVLGLGLGITFLVGWIIIASLISKGNKCKLELGLGLGLGSGMPDGIAYVVSVFFVFFMFSIFKAIPNRVEIGKGMLTGLLFTTVIGIIVVYLMYDKLKPEQTSIKPEEKPGEPADKKSKTKNSGAEKPVKRSEFADEK